MALLHTIQNSNKQAPGILSLPTKAQQLAEHGKVNLIQNGTVEIYFEKRVQFTRPCAGHVL